MGLGYQEADFRAFGLQMKDRVPLFEESVQIIRQCWTGEPFSFHGKHYDLEDVRVLPLPYQRPAALPTRRSWSASGCLGSR